MQSRDRGRQEDGREEAATTGGEHRQSPLFTGDTHHITVKAEEGQMSQGPGASAEATTRLMQSIPSAFSNIVFC